MLRRRSRQPSDPLAGVDAAALPPRWQRFVVDAVAARARWAALVEGVRPGPLRDRLSALGDRVDQGVLAVWETASRAAETERVAATLDADAVTAEYKRARRDPDPDPALVEALSARFRSMQRILNAVEDAEERLEVLDARLGAAVARAAELALTSGTEDELGSELDGVVDELGALRSSLDSLR